MGRADSDLQGGIEPICHNLQQDPIPLFLNPPFLLLGLMALGYLADVAPRRPIGHQEAYVRVMKKNIFPYLVRLLITPFHWSPWGCLITNDRGKDWAG